MVAMSESESKRGSALGCSARLFWMVLGNVALAISGFEICKSRGDRLSAGDLLFWAIVILLVSVRYLDIRFLGGQTATGQPASMGHWRRHAVLLVGASLCLWFLAHGIAYLGL
jgi:hypothetical protein